MRSRNSREIASRELCENDVVVYVTLLSRPVIDLVFLFDYWLNIPLPPSFIQNAGSLFERDFVHPDGRGKKCEKSVSATR